MTELVVKYDQATISRINFDIWMNPYASTRLSLKPKKQQNNSKLYAQFSLKNSILSKDVKMVIAYHKVVRFANLHYKFTIQEIMQNISKSVYDL